MFGKRAARHRDVSKQPCRQIPGIRMHSTYHLNKWITSYIQPIYDPYYIYIFHLYFINRYMNGLYVFICTVYIYIIIYIGFI